MKTMTFTEAVRSYFEKYATFSGRARRSEFWFAYLFTVIVGIVLGAMGEVSGIFKALGWIASLAFFIPSLAVGWRRMHDIGKSGAFYLFLLIPFVG